MTSILFILILASLFAALFYWGFRHLPREDWQIMATVPATRNDDGSWRGINLTFYGFFNASACVFAAAIVLLLMSSIGVPIIATITLLSLLLIVCLPAAKVVARLVERKKSTFTVGGASFVGILLLPWLIQLFNNMTSSRATLRVPIVQMLAATAIAYAFGEAFGRLACISFGCCYGKLLWHTPASLQKIMSRFCFVFRGHTKKVAYASDMSGLPLIPIQAVTAIISTLAGLAGTFFFLNSQWIPAVLVPLSTTQIWRALSETLRADYRGGGTVSAYQIMAIAGLIYSVVFLLRIDTISTQLPDVVAGLRAMINAAVLIPLELLWIIVFLYVGRSSVTGSRISFHVVQDRI